MKALVTGSNGFVGKYLKTELINNGYEVIGVGRTANNNEDMVLNILDYDKVFNIIGDVKPDVIFHLAGQPSVAKSWSLPQCTMELNVNGALNILESVKNNKLETKILLIGSSDQYGKIKTGELPINEETEQFPITPYAVSKRAQEDIGKVYHYAYQMNINMTRSFNHIGIGQSLGFVIPDFAHSIAEIELGLKDKMIVGNVNSYRDFSDVRDIVRAYRLISEKGISGKVYNVGSGKVYQIKELLNLLIKYAKKPIPVEYSELLFRVTDTPVIQCDYTNLKNDTGWQPEISIEDVLSQMLDYYREQLKK